jgi:hypothetical protein
MSDRKLSIGGDATGNFNLGDDARQGDVSVTQAGASIARQALLDQLAALRAQVEPLDAPEAITRIDDLAEEVSAEELDQKGGIKAFDRLKGALAGVAAVTGLLAGIEDQVRALFA